MHRIAEQGRRREVGEVRHRALGQERRIVPEEDLPEHRTGREGDRPVHHTGSEGVHHTDLGEDRSERHTALEGEHRIGSEGALRID